MTVLEALEMLDAAAPKLGNVESKIYPGLTESQALRYVLEGFLASIKSLHASDHPGRGRGRRRLPAHP